LSYSAPLALRDSMPKSSDTLIVSVHVAGFFGKAGNVPTTLDVFKQTQAVEESTRTTTARQLPTFLTSDLGAFLTVDLGAFLSSDLRTFLTSDLGAFLSGDL